MVNSHLVYSRFAQALTLKNVLQAQDPRHKCTPAALDTPTRPQTNTPQSTWRDRASASPTAGEGVIRGSSTDEQALEQILRKYYQSFAPGMVDRAARYAPRHKPQTQALNTGV